MGKINGENLDLKSKLNIVLGIIANAKKDLESLKTEINDVKSDHAMYKKDLNFFNNEFSEYLKESLKVSDNLIKIDKDILMRKNEFYINTKNIKRVIKNNMLIFTTNCIKLKNMIRENVKSLKNIKNNLYSVKKDSDSIQIDLKKLKEEFMNNFNKRAKTRSIIIAKIKNYIFNKRMRARLIINTKIKTNKASSKNNAACTIKDSGIVDACTSTDDLIVKKYADACTSTDYLIVKKYVDACTSADDVCTNENEPCTNENEPCTNENEPCTNENEPCTNENEPCTNENEPCNNKPCTNENEPCTSDHDDDDGDDDDDNSNDIDIDKLYNFNDKVLGNLIIVSKIKKEFSTTIEKIIALLNKVANISKNDLGLKFDNYKELNILADYLINHIWITIYDEINNIDADKKDFNIYVRKYMNIVNDKISLINDILELINDIMRGINVNTSNDIALKKLKHFKSQLRKLINSFNLYIKEDTKNNTEPDTENNTEPDTKNNTESDTKNNTKPHTKDDIESNINDIRASIRKNQITIKNRYKSLLERKKTIRNNIDLVYSVLKKLPSESQLKANELIKLNYVKRFDKRYMA